jgi:Domain of unknown function (DUF1839)
MTRINALPQIDASNYSRSVLHAESCTWLEKNCYVDIWIEVLHALGLEPRAILPFTVAIDFEGDQWTFFKPPHDELRELYGVDVQELNVWRPLIEHAVEHLAAGRLISTEADAFWLPDTSGTDYRRQHTKSTIVLADIDVEQQRLGYFHNAGYFTLDGEDFVRTFRVGYEPDPTFMPLFAETVRFERLVKRPDAELLALSQALWRKHLPRVPSTNPVRRFQQRFERELPSLQARGLAHYHAWAFATTRQLGAAFELAASNLRWMQGLGMTGIEESIAAFDLLSANSKSFILKGARAVNAKRVFDGAAMFDELSTAWERGLKSLGESLQSG